MRNAALVLGIIAGVFGMIVGFFGWGYTVAVEALDLPHRQVADVELLRAAALGAPLLAIAGGAMAPARALWGGALLLLSAAGMYYGFGFHFYTMFPIVFAGLAGLFAVAAGRPDEARAHF